MIRVVLDTNVVVSALLKPAGAEAAVLLLVLEGMVFVGISDAILAEYEDVLSRPKFKRPPEVVKGLVADLRSVGRLVKPKQRVAVSPDESDNRFLECAEALKAHFLVTGNTRHFPQRWKGTEVVTARQFIDRLATHESR
jgi:putative PIN family toxin of toxin-antitoxin system